MANENGVIFEIVRVGAYAKVTAMDTRSLVEVSVIGPAKGANEQLKQIALRKLQMVLERGR